MNLLGTALGGESWAAWRALLLAVMGEPLRPKELEPFRRLTERDTSPTERVSEFWAVIGRRGGKSRAIAALAVYLAGLCAYPMLRRGGAWPRALPIGCAISRDHDLRRFNRKPHGGRSLPSPNGWSFGFRLHGNRTDCGPSDSQPYRLRWRGPMPGQRLQLLRTMASQLRASWERPSAAVYSTARASAADEARLAVHDPQPHSRGETVPRRRLVGGSITRQQAF
jgi:hypothetical protein